MRVPGAWKTRAGLLPRRPLAVALVLLIALAAIQPVAAQSDKAPEAAIDAARQMLALQKYDAALKRLDTVLENHPDNNEARFLKAIALAHRGKTQSALALFESLTETFPKMAQAWNNLGVLRARTGNLVGARKALKKAAQLQPEDVAAQHNLGDVYLALAYRAYRDASALAPQNAMLRNKLRTLQRLMGSAAAEQSQPRSTDGGQNPTQAVSAAAPAAGVADAPGAQSRQATVRAALRQWARAWSAQDLDAYFAAYSSRFDPLGTRTIEQWRALRVRRVSGPEWISVELSQIEVKLTGPDTAKVHFDQDYESGDYQDHVRKTITMVHSPRGWLITTES